MLIGYARASLEKQSIERQLDELTAAGVKPENIFNEKITGTRRDREELNRMLEALQPGDTVVAVELSRMGRSTKDLLEIIDLIRKKEAHFRSLSEAWLDTTTPQGQLVFTIFAALCQFERDLTVERTKSGLAAANARGRFGGRPSKQKDRAEEVMLLYHNGVRPSDIARQIDVSRSTVTRILTVNK
jgi:DNA invertase Pin-like site-specific DNA recombinase